jgi:hypothetical protein
MTERTALLTRITEAEALPGYRLRLRYEDGAAGVVDMSATLAKGGAFAALAGARFSTFTIADGGRAVCWLDDAGNEVDFDVDALRLRLGVEQAAAE